MPQAAIAAVAEFLVAAGFSTATAAFFAEVFVYAATTYLLNRAAEALTPRSRSAGLGSGTEVNFYDSAAPVRIVYGQMKTGGMETIPPVSGGINNVLLHKVLTLAGHEVDSYNFTHFDSTTITNAQIGTFAFTSSDGMVSSGTYNGHAFIRRYRGTSTDSGDRMLMDANSVAFGNFRGRGIAKAVVGFKFNQEIYGSVPTVTFTYQGKRCYDPRLDVTPGASPTNASYIAWTRNAALCLTDYLMSDLGGSYASTDIDWDTVVTAANYCDGSVNIPGPSTQSRYTCNGVLFATDEFTENVRSLVNAMLGRVIFRDGKWRMYAGSWQTPTFTIQKSDWISGLSIRFEQGKKKRFNQMRTSYVDPAREWQLVESLPRTNATYKAADGAELLDAETEQLLCTNEYEAQRKGEFLLRQSRNQIVVAGRLPPRFQDLALWDTGTIVFDHLGWASKTFRCVGCDMNPDGSMDVVFSEEQSTDWTDLDAADYNSPSTAALPEINVTTPSEPQSLSIATAINGTLGFEIGRSIVQPFNTRYQLIRSTNSANAAVGTIVYDGLDLRVNLVQPSSNHWYWARAYVNPSSPSAYFPNTFGLLGNPLGFVTAQINTNAATEIYVTGADRISGFSPAGASSYSDLNTVRDGGGSLIQSAGATTTFTNTIEVGAVAQIVGNFRANASTNSVTNIYAYMENLSTGSVYVSNSLSVVTLTQSIASYVLQDNFDVSSGYRYRMGLRRNCSASSVNETWEIPLKIRIEIIKR